MGKSYRIRKNNNKYEIVSMQGVVLASSLHKKSAERLLSIFLKTNKNKKIFDSHKKER